MKRILSALILCGFLIPCAYGETIISPGGYRYVGDVVSGLPNGQGTWTWTGGNSYVGEFRDGVFHGKGTFTFADGTNYVGSWRDGKRHGQGTLTASDGKRVVGYWQDGNPWNAISYNADRSTVDGTFKAGVWCEYCQPANKEVAASPSLQLVGTGTAVVVARNYLLTASHVIDECAKVAVRHSHEDIDVEIAAWDVGNDVGLLKSKKYFQHIAKFRGGKPIRLGDTVVNYGYPLAGELSDHAKITKGEINSLAGMGNDSSVFQYDAATQPGNSGGPVLDLSGNIVGIVSSQLSKKYLDATGHIAQNVNFAVKSYVAEGFLSSNGVNPERAESIEELRTADIAEKAEKFTVLVGCWQ